MATVFFSYAHADEGLRDRLERHLAMLKRQGVIDVWHDRRILPGEDFGSAIATELERADLILLLVSPDFLGVGLLLRTGDGPRDGTPRGRRSESAAGYSAPCDWHSAPFGQLLATPTDGKPITKFADLDDAFLEVTNAIKATLGTQRQAAPAAARPAIAATTVATAMSRSSNLRLKKSFTEADKDRFLDEAFEFMARFFESSLAELASRNPRIEASFKRIDAQQFTAVVYRDGAARARCRVFLTRSIGSAIAYSANDRGMGDSFQRVDLRPCGRRKSLFCGP